MFSQKVPEAQKYALRALEMTTNKHPADQQATVELSEVIVEPYS